GAARRAGAPPHAPDRELVGQGLANIAVPFFGGIPATGAIARTAVNIRAGAKTRLSGVVHGLAIALVLVALGPLAAQIPLAVLAGILIAVSARMIEWEQVRLVGRSTRSDMGVLALTFVSTVVFDLVLAVEIGVVAAAVLFIRRMADLHLVGHPEVATAVGLPAPLAAEVAVYDLDRPLFFGDARRFLETLLADTDRRAVILKMDAVTTLDVTAAVALADGLWVLRRRGVIVALCGLPPVTAALLDRLAIMPGPEAVLRFMTVEAAVAEVGQQLAMTPSSVA
ncbi:MAG: SulP family inorganic anion transporter, partial [Candidatus Sericytochromatia bacterium]